MAKDNKVIEGKDFSAAAKAAEQEILDEKKDHIKSVMKSVLQEIQKQTEVKTKAEDALRILKLDLEDLRAGKLDNIDRRHESEQVRRISPVHPRQLIDDLAMVIPYFTISPSSISTLIGDTTSISAGSGSSSGTISGTADNTTWTIEQANITKDFFTNATSGSYTVAKSDGTFKEYHF